MERDRRRRFGERLDLELRRDWPCTDDLHRRSIARRRNCGRDGRRRLDDHLHRLHRGAGEFAGSAAMSKLYILRLAAFAVCIVTVIACGDNKLGPSTPASVSIVSGDTQTILVGNRASGPLVALIRNSDGSPLPNIPVRWAVASGGGSLATLLDTTDVDGHVQATYRSPAIAGRAKVTATAAQQTVIFTMT